VAIRQAEARRLRLLDFEVFFLGTAMFVSVRTWRDARASLPNPVDLGKSGARHTPKRPPWLDAGAS
jgi:hypothetical protein